MNKLKQVIAAKINQETNKHLDFYIYEANEIYDSLEQIGAFKGYENQPLWKYAQMKANFPGEMYANIRKAKYEYIKEHIYKNATVYIPLDMLVQKVLDYSLQHGGATIYPGTGLPIKHGFAVGGLVLTKTVSQIDYESIWDFIGANWNIYKGDNISTELEDKKTKQKYLYVKDVNRAFIGTWFDEKAGHWDIDVSEVLPTAREAFDTCIERNEIAYYNLDKGETVRIEDVLKNKDVEKGWHE